MIVDYHMHLRGPAEGREGPIEHTVAAVERFAEAAAARGVDEIGFTEHVYYFREFDGLVEHPYQRSKLGHDLDSYVDAVSEGKRRGLPVKLGIEVDWVPGREGELADLLAPYPWDFLLGSVHIVDGDAVDMEPGLWARHSVEDVWARYFAAVRHLAASGLVDVLAHLDLAKVFGRRPAPDVVTAHHAEVAAAVGEAGIAVEVSTAGLRKPVGELYPAPELLARCRAGGAAATLASDAHVAHDVGRDFPAALDLLRGAGYETVTVFEGRVARQEPLG
ncbi:MAG: histidinol-phosphatase HisJ family protein [Gaiellaceae bacterium]